MSRLPGSSDPAWPPEDLFYTTVWHGLFGRRGVRLTTVNTVWRRIFRQRRVRLTTVNAVWHSIFRQRCVRLTTIRRHAHAAGRVGRIPFQRIPHSLEPTQYGIEPCMVITTDANPGFGKLEPRPKPRGEIQRHAVCTGRVFRCEFAERISHFPRVGASERQGFKRDSAIHRGDGNQKVQ